MGERDIPSVPVTTLAGLTSLTDLLSELPISDSLSISSSLNKSLLFHPRVAEEANNLLSVRDNTLINQLLNAIEQTNSDHIELKDKYVESLNRPGSSERPQLLQAIHSYRQDVFNSQVHQRTVNASHQQQPIQNFPQPVFNQQSDNYSYSQPSLHHSSNYPEQDPQQQMMYYQQQQHLPPPQQIQPNQQYNNSFTQQNHFPDNALQQNVIHHQLPNEQQSNVILSNFNYPTSSDKQNYNQQLNNPQVNVSISIPQNQQIQQSVINKPSSATTQSASNQQNSNVIQQNLHYANNLTPNKPNNDNKDSNQKQEIAPRNNEYLQQQQQNKNIDALGRPGSIAPDTDNMQTQLQNKEQVAKQTVSSQNSKVFPAAKMLSATLPSTTTPSVISKPTITASTSSPSTTPIKGPTMPAFNTPSVIRTPHTPSINATTPTKPPNHSSYNSHNSKPAPTFTINVAGALMKPGSEVEDPLQQTQKVQVQPDPAKAPKPVDKKELFKLVDLENVESVKLRKCVVQITKLSEEDLQLMQTDIKKFIEKSPKLAANLGLRKDNEGLFMKMKEDEKRYSSLLAKRKMNEPENPEDYFNKPKLRKIEKKVAPVVKKMSKEELMKTNTYQRFMSIMEQIFEQLDETEGPMNLDDTDENFECITTKLMSNIGSEAAKLKARHAIDSIPENKLSLLINYAMRSVHLAKNFSAADLQDDLVGDECVEKILNAVEASLLVCNIYTSKGSKFMQEDNVDLIIKFIQFQLRETIFPSYDPVYSIETKKKADNRSNKKKAPSYQQKGLSMLYSKVVELTKVLVSLFNSFHFVDTIVIHASALGVEPFFVDNIETLQFVCLDLVTSIFQNEKYSHHRRNVLADILSSVDRLPQSKRNLRPYKLTNNGGNIQMMTALVLQLIQCAVVLPDHLGGSSENKRNNIDHSSNSIDLFVIGKYDTALSIGGNFLTTFLNKCKSRSGETDFRPLFENFIHDLLTTVNKPEWPASELLLSLLGTMLVKYMSDKNVEQAIRVVSLEYLGIVASRLRRDTVESRCKVATMDALIKYIKIEQEKEGDDVDNNSICQLDPEEERTEFLQKILLDFLAVNAHEDNIVWTHARHFYLTQWYRDIIQRKKKITDGEKGYASRKKQPKKRKKYASESDDTDKDSDVVEVKDGVDQELNSEIYKILDERKKYYLSQSTLYNDQKNLPTTNDIKTYIDYSSANLIAQYLASKRSFSQSFDTYLQKIILVVREPIVAIRTRAMKCLGNIVEVDQLVLARKDMQMGVQQKLLDPAISVREAAVDLVGKYILSDQDLIDQYYDIISQRILDTGVSVRKRVIKILRDICIEYPAHDKIPDICCKMIRRVSDEEGIQKLVMDVFMAMWFTPCNDNNKAAMERKITQIIDVVCSSHETGTQGFDSLLKTVFEPKENKEDAKVKKEIPKTLIKACQQIVNGLVEATMKLEGSENRKLVGCITALHLFAKIRPQLLVNHAITLEPYLNIKVSSANNSKFISSIAEILEQVVPLMEHPSETFLADLEAHLMMLILCQNQPVVTSCISCLATVINKITKNYKLVRDCFRRFYMKQLVLGKDKLLSDPSFAIESLYYPQFRRSIFTVGLIMRYFDFKEPDVYGRDDQDGGLPANICTDVFETLAFFLSCSHSDICKETLKSMGNFCVKNFEYLTKIELRDYYHYLLTQEAILTDMKVTVLRNILIYLTEEENKMVRNDKDWQAQSKLEDLKEMGDVSSGMASRVIQLYLKEILGSFLHRYFGVRLWAMKVIEIVLRQGLVHPVQIVPYLICLSTDPEKEVAHCADHHLQEIDKQYPGFVNMKSYFGMQLSFDLQNLLQKRDDNTIVRGFRIKDKNEPPSALNGFLYTLLRNTKPQRRALVQSMTKQFDDGKTSLSQMLYLADNLAYFPYVVQDEPLYIIHHIDVLISVTGTNLLATFKEGLKPSPGEKDNGEAPNPLEDDDDDDQETIYNKLPEDTRELESCITSAQGCMLLLILKQHLKDIYGITDSKISRYSPSEGGKIYDKAMQRRSNSTFNPKATITLLKENKQNDNALNEEERMELVARYLDFKQLMLKLDPDDPDLLDEDEKPKADETPNASPVKQDGSNHVNNVNSEAVTATNNSTTNNDTFKPTLNVTTTVNKTSKTSKATPRKQPTRNAMRKKKRRAHSSSEEDEASDYDMDYE